MSRAYYNENDPKAVAWLRELIAAGLIAPGDVDDRSITEVSPHDLHGYTQHHFFAGIGGWSLALRMGGWADSRRVCTASCPCQPFSTAGHQKGEEDARHLWPVLARLIAKVRFPIIFGEQVASKDGRKWFAGVRAHMERMAYDFGGADLCSAGVGAPNIRQRLWFVAESEEWRRSERRRVKNQTPGTRRVERGKFAGCGSFDFGAMGNAEGDDQRRISDGTYRQGQPSRGSSGVDGSTLGDSELLRCDPIETGNGCGQESPRSENGNESDRSGEPGSLGNAVRKGRKGRAQPGTHRGAKGGRSRSGAVVRSSEDGGMANANHESGRAEHEREPGRREPQADDSTERGGIAHGLGESIGEGSQGRGEHGEGTPGRIEIAQRPIAETGESGGMVHPSLSTGERYGPFILNVPRQATVWDYFELIACSDGKARRIEPGTFPLAHGIPGRVGLLRGYGNAINPWVAAQFIEACKEMFAETR